MRDTTAEAVDRPGIATTVVWWWDAARDGIAWASPGLLAMLGLADRAALLADPAHPALVAASRGLEPGRETTVIVQRGGAVLHGTVAASRVILADGRPGVRLSWAIAARPAATPDTALQARAFAAAPMPLAVLDDHGVAVATNAAFESAFGAGPRPVDADALARAGWVGRSTPLPDAGGLSLLSLTPPTPRDAAVVEASALARIAHEFRSPLTAVLGFAEFLGATLDDMPPARAKGYLADLGLAAERMRRLADDLVALGDGPPGLRVAETALDPLLDTALRMAAPAADAHGVVLETPAPSGLLVLADGDALGRAVANLLDNAIRHGARRGGTVALRVVDGGKAAGAAIEVADDGPGLDAASLAEALEPYGRPGERADTAAGGLGLPIVRDIAKAHGGVLDIETAPGAGFIARLRLPPGRVFRVRAR